MYSGTMVQSGTVFLTSLRRRIKADYRLHLLETAAISMLAGALTSVHLEYGRIIRIGNPQHALVAGLVAAGLWLVIGTLPYTFLLSRIRAYVTSLLVDTGLLYLVLEHDPHDALKPMRRRETIAKLKLNPQSELSFRGRILIFLRTYSSCAGSLGFHAYPGFVRRIGMVVNYALILVAGLFAVQVYLGVQNALSFHAVQLLPLKVSAWMLLILILSRATIGIARRFGLWLALTDLLIEDQADGRAVLAGG